jgi:hypothetical protein
VAAVVLARPPCRQRRLRTQPCPCWRRRRLQMCGHGWRRATLSKPLQRCEVGLTTTHAPSPALPRAWDTPTYYLHEFGGGGEEGAVVLRTRACGSGASIFFSEPKLSKRTSREVAPHFSAASRVHTFTVPVLHVL